MSLRAAEERASMKVFGTKQPPVSLRQIINALQDFAHQTNALPGDDVIGHFVKIWTEYKKEALRDD